MLEAILRRAVAATLWAILVVTPGVATARSLHWSSIEVHAVLDAEGRLQIEERQTMVFTGDWNGGERRFRLGIGHQLELRGITRVDPGGEVTELVEGDPDLVDRFAWHDRETLRWRSRLPSDPVYDGETITYLVRYTLSGVLRSRGRRGANAAYRLDHDFAFTDRVGTIERFNLNLELDAVWQPTSELRQQLEVQNLVPGNGVVLTSDLAYIGAGRPAGVSTAIALPIRLAAFAAALAALAALFVRFRRHERSRGRFEAAEVPATLDRDWLEQHVLDLRPEEVGAIWDGKVGPPEVAATIARLVAEGKLSTSVDSGLHRWWRKPKLELELLARYVALTGYERKLIDKFFFRGRKTDTAAIREHYKKTGFDPAGVIRGPLEKRLRERLGQPLPRPKTRLPAILFWGIAALLALEGLTQGRGVMVVLALLLVAAPLPVVVGSLWVGPYRRKTRGLTLASAGFAVPALALAVVCCGATLAGELFGGEIPDFHPGIFGVLALAAFPVMALCLWLYFAATRDSPEVVRKRALLGAVRRHFAAELKQARPALDDDWFPYLIAFGLDREVDRWFASFGGDLGTTRPGAGHLSGSSTGSSSSSSWTGGGGSFGGAGATAAWAGAATGLAAGVARPSSGGGGGSSGGGSSGGGGGGGW